MPSLTRSSSQLKTMDNADAILATPRLSQARYGFVVDGLQLTAAAGVMTELIALATVFPIPKSAAALVGVINHRGSTVPVFDASSSPAAQVGVRPKQCNVLIFGEGEHRAGMVLNTTPSLVELLPTESQTKPLTHLAAYLVQPWMSALANPSIWWDFDYRSAFLAMAQGAQFTEPHTAEVSAGH
jgi:chemotaxis signal transduction protein